MESLIININDVDLEVYFTVIEGEKGDYYQPPVSDYIEIEKVTVKDSEVDIIPLLYDLLEEIEEKLVKCIRHTLATNGLGIYDVWASKYLR